MRSVTLCTSCRLAWNALGVRVAQQMSLRQCKTRNFCAHFAQTNKAQVQKGNKKKILVLKPSSRVAFENPFKTALNVWKNSKLDSVFKYSLLITPSYNDYAIIIYVFIQLLLITDLTEEYLLRLKRREKWLFVAWFHYSNWLVQICTLSEYLPLLIG